MLPVFILRPNSSDKVLDMCAAPGSKTSLINEILSRSDESCLIANDLDLERSCMLMHQLRRDPCSSLIVT